MATVRAHRSRRRDGLVAAITHGVVPVLLAVGALLVAPVGSSAAPQPTSSTLSTAAGTLPTGFLLQEIPTGLVPPSAAGPGDLLTDFVYLPDESVIATGKYGRVQWV